MGVLWRGLGDHEGGSGGLESGELWRRVRGLRVNGGALLWGAG